MDLEMNESEKNWFNDAMSNGWIMPSVVWWKRLPVIRHFRHAHHLRKATQFNAVVSSAGLPQYDRWVLYGMVKGYESVK